MDNIADDVDAIINALNIPIESEDENCDIGDSDDELNWKNDDQDLILPVFYQTLNEDTEPELLGTSNNCNKTSNENLIKLPYCEPSTSKSQNVQNNESDLDQLLEQFDRDYLQSPIEIENIVKIPNSVDKPINSNKRSNKNKKTARDDPVKNYKDVEWKCGNLIFDDNFFKFHGEKNFSSNLLNLDTPLQYFSYFFDDELMQHIVEHTILYSVQKNPNKPLKISVTDIKKFIGILNLMSIIHLPNSRSFWNPIIGNRIIQDTMSLNKFELIKQFLHFNDNTKMLPSDHENHDRLYKLRPFLNYLKRKFQTISLEENLSIDEQLCPTKARSFLKQYLPLKPHKWGYKIFVLSGISGFMYNFEVYTGLENNSEKRLSTEPNLGACANVVLRLSRIVPKFQNFKIYFDNYYTTLALVVYLAKQGICSLGTLRRNRVPGIKLSDEKQLKKKSRGFFSECLTQIDGVPVTATEWKDNKVVTLLSNFSGAEPASEVTRFDKKKNEHISVPCPNVVKIYNQHMGGVDLLDSIIARYRIAMRSKKWYFKLFFHFMDVTMVNAWLLYRKTKKENTMSLADFRREIAVSLCMQGSNICTPTTRGRKRNIRESPSEPKKKRGMY